MSEKKPDKQIDTMEWLRQHDLDEVINTVNLEILDDYSKTVIMKDDFTTIRKVKIISLPKSKKIDSKKFKGTIHTMIINDSGKDYQLKADSIALQRSLIKIIMSEMKKNGIKNINPKNLDYNAIIDKFFNISRTSFTNKNGYTNQCLVFDEIK